MFFKGCLTSLSLSGTGGIKLQASPGFIGGCQVKVGSLLSHSHGHGCFVVAYCLFA